MTKRQLVAVGLAVFALMLFAFVTATMAAPADTPLLQTGETEPNNSFDEANAIGIPGYVIGQVSNTPVTEAIDYFVMNTSIGHAYRASLTVCSSENLELRLALYDGDQRYLKTSFSSSAYTSMSWESNKDSHYIRVEAVIVSTTVKTAVYRLDVDRLAATPTPTNMPLPGEDDYEPNNSRGTAYVLPIAVSASVTDANFWPQPDEDWYAFFVKGGRTYRASTSNLSGVDTYVEIHDRSGGRVAKDDDGGGGFASKVEWDASYYDFYYIRVINLISTSGPDDTYDLTVSEINPGTTSVWLPLCFRHK